MKFSLTCILIHSSYCNYKWFELDIVNECRQKHDWLLWKEAIEAELTSLTKCKLIGLVVQTSKNFKPIGYKWVFIRKLNKYKARLRPGIDYKDTYYLVMDTITFQF